MATERRRLHALRRIFYGCCCLALLFASSAIADTGTGRYALVIGNGQYSHISDLKNAVNDAELMSKTLQSLGFEVSLLKNADSQQMEDAVYTFGERLVEKQQGEAVLFFYSGHGLQDDRGSLLLPVDYDADNNASGITLQDILSEFQNGSFGSRIIVIDACRKDDALGQNRLTFNSQFAVPQGTLLAFSTGSSEPAVDGAGQNSPYTDALTTAMKQPGLELTGVFRATRKNVSQRTNHQQQPQQINVLNEEFYFVQGNHRSASVNFGAREHKLWNKIKTSNRAKDYSDFLEQFPDGEFADMARKRYRQLETFTAGHSGTPSKSRYGVVLVYQASLDNEMVLSVAEVDSSSVLSGKLMRDDIVLTINHKPLPEGQDPNKILDEAFDRKGRLDLLVKRGTSVYNISIRK